MSSAQFSIEQEIFTAEMPDAAAKGDDQAPPEAIRTEDPAHSPSDCGQRPEAPKAVLAYEALEASLAEFEKDNDANIAMLSTACYNLGVKLHKSEVELFSKTTQVADYEQELKRCKSRLTQALEAVAQGNLKSEHCKCTTMTENLGKLEAVVADKDVEIDAILGYTAELEEDNQNIMESLNDDGELQNKLSALQQKYDRVVGYLQQLHRGRSHQMQSSSSPEELQAQPTGPGVESRLLSSECEEEEDKLLATLDEYTTIVCQRSTMSTEELKVFVEMAVQLGGFLREKDARLDQQFQKINDLEYQLEHTNTQRDALQAEIAERMASTSDRENQHQAALAQNAALHFKLESSSSMWQHEMEKFERFRTASGKVVREQKAQLERRDSDMFALQEKLTASTLLADEKTAACKDLDAKYQASQQRVKDLTEDLAKMNTKLARKSKCLFKTTEFAKQELETQEAKYNAKIKALCKENDEYEAALAEHDALLKASATPELFKQIQKRLAAANSEVEDLKKQLLSEKMASRLLSKEYERRQALCEKLTKEKDSQALELTKAIDEVYTTVKALDEARVCNNSFRYAIKQQKNAIASKELEVVKAKNEWAELNDTFIAYGYQVREEQQALTETIKSTQALLESKTVELSQAVQKMADKQRELDNFTQEWNQAVETIHWTQARLKATTSELEEAKRTAESTQSRLDLTTTKLENAKSLYRKQEKQIKTLQNREAKLRKERSVHLDDLQSREKIIKEIKELLNEVEGELATSNAEHEKEKKALLVNAEMEMEKMQHLMHAKADEQRAKDEALNEELKKSAEERMTTLLKRYNTLWKNSRDENDYVLKLKESLRQVGEKLQMEKEKVESLTREAEGLRLEADGWQIEDFDAEGV